jgi:phospholipid-binding lipoprotein MlaA
VRLTVISATALLVAALAAGTVRAEESGEPAATDGYEETGSSTPGEDEADDDAYLLYEDDPLLEMELESVEVPDPWENSNRRIFKFNRVVDKWAWRPITKSYQFLFPTFLRRGINRIFLNAETPVIFTNQLLQAEWRASGMTIARFVLNSTAGYAGFFDAADIGAGWKRRHEDFGQTMAVWGVSSGPYIIVPVFGPSTVRDTFGTLIDRLFDPLTFFVGPIEWMLFLGAGEGISLREAADTELRELEESSIDFYSALRSAYFQVRESEIQNHMAERERERRERAQN